MSNIWGKYGNIQNSFIKEGAGISFFFFVFFYFGGGGGGARGVLFSPGQVY